MLDKEWLKNTLAKCQEYGYRTSPVSADGKTKPRKNGEDYKDLKDYAHAEKVALILDDVILLDYDGNKDDAKGEIMSVEELEEKLDFDLVGMPAPFQVNDAGDSIHWLFKIPEGVDRSELANKVAKRKKAEAGSDGNPFPFMDIQWGDRLVVNMSPAKTLNLLPPSEWEDCPDIIIEELKKNKGYTASVVEEDGDLLQAVSESEAVQEDELREQLSYINPSELEYDGWLEMMTATKVACAGQEYGRQVFKEWSSQSPKHDAHTTDYKWDSFSIHGGITQNTFFYLTNRGKKLVVATKSRQEVDAMIARIMTAEIETLESLVIPDICKGDWDVVRKEQLAKCVQTRYRELTGATVKLPEVRKMIETKVSYGELTDDMPRPEWCEPWVYLASHEVFLNIDNSVEYSRTAFDMAFGKIMTANENGQKMRPSKFVADYGFIEVLPRKEYLPMIEGRIIDQGGYSILNSFDPRSVPSADAQHTEDGLRAVAIVKRHFSLLCNGVSDDSLVLEQWFAHQVQNMGIKLAWAPLICSIQGVGKSVLETMLRNVIGHKNVGTVAPKSVLSDFNGWATDVSVNVLNELRISGKNRHDAANALKPLITDETIQINDKNSKVYQTRNTANYICFTNFADAIPMDETDRRWWAIRVNLESLDDIQDRAGINKNLYFDELHWAIRTQGRQIRKWLLEYKITDEFKALRTAPETQFKLDMVATERSTVDYMDEVIDILNRGKKWIHPKCVCIKDLMVEIGMDTDIQLTPRMGEVKWILKRLGFTSRGAQVVMGGETKRVWTKGDMSNDDIRGLFSQ